MIEIQVLEFLSAGGIGNGIDFSFDLDAFSEIYLMVSGGSDPDKCLLLKDNQFKNRGFLLLEGTFWGQKVGFKECRETIVL